MSKASEWLARREAAESEDRACEASRPACIHGGFRASVTAHGGLTLLHCDGGPARSMLADEALELARWILDTFGETP